MEEFLYTFYKTLGFASAIAVVIFASLAVDILLCKTLRAWDKYEKEKTILPKGK